MSDESTTPDLRARQTGIEIEFSAVHVWTLRDGKAMRMEARPD